MSADYGAKTGTGFVSNEQAEVSRKERLRRLALESIDLAKDPYFMRNHVGQYECRLCLTAHKNEGNYLAHTQGKRHQQNLAKRALQEAAEREAAPAPQRREAIKRSSAVIGRPAYRVTKMYDPEDNTRALLFQIEYPEILEEEVPRYRVMSAIEQKQEATDWRYQYVVFAAEPYETICFKVPNIEIDMKKRRDGGSRAELFRHWDQDGKVYSVQLPFVPMQVETGHAQGAH